jgi:superfamily II DNA or RNA helicase
MPDPIAYITNVAAAESQSASALPTASPSAAAVRLAHEAGTVRLSGPAELLAPLAALPKLVPDPRSGGLRTDAVNYRMVVERLMADGTAFEDRAKRWERTVWSARSRREPLPHQSEALAAWWSAGGRGVVVLPTGTGKTYLAVLAILKANRPTLVVVPTLDLMQQWYEELGLALTAEVGLLGGGHYEPKPLCVTTYDSAYLYMDRLGDRYGLVVFDECHHLPGPTIAQAALACMAPFRLGLTATPERPDGRHELYADLIGPEVYRRHIAEMAGRRLAEYDTEILHVELSEADRADYDKARATYREFVDRHGLRVSRPEGWGRFLMLAAQTAAGRAAFAAYRRQKELANAAPEKMDVLERLLRRHAGERTLVFTQDNATVYGISRRFLLPAITHQTKVKERKEILDRFNAGSYPAIVTAKVLNEGVNVPEAGVAVVFSGSASVREHVQRLGRILRPREGKRARLYELITRDTNEELVSERRRRHEAYGHDAEPEAAAEGEGPPEDFDYVPDETAGG